MIIKKQKNNHIKKKRTKKNEKERKKNEKNTFIYLNKKANLYGFICTF